MVDQIDHCGDFDRSLHAAQARLTGGLSMTALSLAWADWAAHMIDQPGRQMELAQLAADGWLAIIRQAAGLHFEPKLPDKQDNRFQDPGWKTGPAALISDAFLRVTDFWNQATQNTSGVSEKNERIVNFAARQILDVMAPSNIPFFNPEVLAKAQATSGDSLREGMANFIEDLCHAGRSGAQTLPMQPGKDVAVTPGKVVFRNDLLELIQYEPTEKNVRPEPVLIVPAWIMKYYILDLSPQNSMVKYLVGQGFTVFCISWRNPDASMRDIGMDDYRSLGVMAALDAITVICGDKKIHAAGYCLGGTLLSITAAAMARDLDERLATITLMAAQTDFTEAGELQLFVNESQLHFLDDVMWSEGYLDAQQMSGAFQMLRANDLIWSQMIRRYYLGEKDQPNDLMSWNMDTTRMPYRMHSEYLHKLFLNNDLAEGRFQAGGREISLADIRAPFFVIGTEKDHIAPWRSVYKLQQLNQGDFTFILTSGGHNAGVVSEPGHPRRHFCQLERPAGGLFVPPDEWQSHAVCQEGSWWVVWSDWLSGHSNKSITPPMLGAPKAGYPILAAAPGTYVFQR